MAYLRISWGVCRVRRLLLPLLIAFCIACPADGQDTLSVAAVQRRDTPFKINHPAGAEVKAIFAKVEDGGIVWAYLPDSHFIRSDSVTYMAAPPGEYLITVGGTEIVKVIEEGQPNPRPEPPRPEPAPNPEPQPEPEPEPSPDKLSIDWAVWVEESADRFENNAETRTMYDTSLWRWLAEKKINRFVYDDEMAGSKPWVKFAGDVRPALILYQREPQKHLTFPAPKSVEAAKALIEEHSNK